MLDFSQDQIGLEDLAQAVALSHTREAEASALARGEAVEVDALASIMRDALPQCAQRITAYLSEHTAGSRGRRREALDILSNISPDVAALIGLNTYLAASLNYMRRSFTTSSLTVLLVRIGEQLAVEHYANLARAADRKAVERLIRQNRLRRATQAQRELGKILVNHGADPLAWDQEFYLALAEPVADAVLATDLFDLIEPTNEEEHLRVCLSSQGSEAVLASQERQPWVRPRLLPMVVEPAAWSDPDQGPYLTESNRTFVRAMGRSQRSTQTAVRRDWDTERLRPFQSALNALGKVAYSVDVATLDAIEWAIGNDVPVGGLPSRRVVEAVPPSDEVQDADSRRMLWRNYHKSRELNLLNRTLGVGVKSDLNSLRLLQNYPAIYQPHYADFRGRLYPASSLSHHRQDYIRASFRFAKSEPLGEHGRKWLAIHIANCAAGDTYGKLDKASWQEREAWTERNSEMIASIASTWKERPDLWTQTDAPFAFLQGCREWQNTLISSSPKSTIIVGLDGTCSGYQHYAAALRSPQEGRLVNLIPADHPQDVYAAVANSVRSILEGWAQQSGSSDADKLTPVLAQKWLDYGITRSTVKRQTMTFPYSSETYGFAKQIQRDIMAPLTWAVISGDIPEHPLEIIDEKGPDGGFRASLVLARAIWQALQFVAVKASEGMQWLKQTATLMGKHGRYVDWRSPSGVPVIHQYHMANSRRVKTVLGRRSINLVMGEHLRSLDLTKQRNAIAPNLIHSLDAAHLHLVTDRMWHREGVPQLAMIHDSFGTVPGSVEVLARVIREEFVTMYTNHCPFTELRDRALSLLPEDARAELAPIPTKGDLDLQQVLDSPYFFC